MVEEIKGNIMSESALRFKEEALRREKKCTHLCHIELNLNSEEIKLYPGLVKFREEVCATVIGHETTDTCDLDFYSYGNLTKKSLEERIPEIKIISFMQSPRNPRLVSKLSHNLSGSVQGFYSPGGCRDPYKNYSSRGRDPNDWYSKGGCRQQPDH
jgi:hypothetical protein